MRSCTNHHEPRRGSHLPLARRFLAPALFVVSPPNPDGVRPIRLLFLRARSSLAVGP